MGGVTGAIPGAISGAISGDTYGGLKRGALTGATIGALGTPIVMRKVLPYRPKTREYAEAVAKISDSERNALSAAILGASGLAGWNRSPSKNKL